MSLIESVLYRDTQTAPGHPCIYCLREIYGSAEICTRCEDRLNEEYDWED